MPAKKSQENKAVRILKYFEVRESQDSEKVCFMPSDKPVSEFGDDFAEELVEQGLAEWVESEDAVDADDAEGAED